MHFITEVENSLFYYFFFFSILFERNVQSKIIKKKNWTKWNERAEVLTSSFFFFFIIIFLAKNNVLERD